MVKVLQNIIITDASVQNALAKKRDYLKETFGKESETGRPSEQIPFDFAPPIETAAQASKASAERPVVPEGTVNAANGTNDVAMALNWIRAANKLAAESARRVPGSPFAETGCCFTPARSPGQ